MNGGTPTRRSTRSARRRRRRARQAARLRAGVAVPDARTDEADLGVHGRQQRDAHGDAAVGCDDRDGHRHDRGDRGDSAGEPDAPPGHRHQPDRVRHRAGRAAASRRSRTRRASSTSSTARRRRTLLQTPADAALERGVLQGVPRPQRRRGPADARGSGRHRQGRREPPRQEPGRSSRRPRPTTRATASTGAQTNIVEIAHALCTAVKAFKLGLTSSVIIPAMRDDPHGAFDDMTQLAANVKALGKIVRRVHGGLRGDSGSVGLRQDALATTSSSPSTATRRRTRRTATAGPMARRTTRTGSTSSATAT